MVVLAAACLAIGLGAGAALRLVEPAVTQLAGPTAALDGNPVDGLFPISATALLLALLAGMVVLALARRRLLAKRPVRETVTWDCGYAAPTASMQYTATGFAQPLTQAAEGILRPRVESQLPQGVYPASGAYHADTPDVARRVLFDPLFRAAAERLGQLRWLQQGRVHWYVFYLVAVLALLLGWALWA